MGWHAVSIDIFLWHCPLVIIVQLQCCYCYFVFAHANAISREIRHFTVTDNLLKPHGILFSSSTFPHRPHNTHCLPLDRVKVKHRLAPLHCHVMSHNRNRQPRKERLERRRLYLLSKQLINNGFKRITAHGAPDDESSATTNLRNAESAGYYTTSADQQLLLTRGEWTAGAFCPPLYFSSCWAERGNRFSSFLVIDGSYCNWFHHETASLNDSNGYIY